MALIFYCANDATDTTTTGDNEDGEPAAHDDDDARTTMMILVDPDGPVDDGIHRRQGSRSAFLASYKYDSSTGAGEA